MRSRSPPKSAAPNGETAGVKYSSRKKTKARTAMASGTPFRRLKSGSLLRPLDRAISPTAPPKNPTVANMR